jgi:hypothetical protein
VSKVRNIIVTKHAVKRIKERFGIPEKQIQNYVNQCLKNAKLLAIVDYNGEKQRLFAHKGKVFILKLEEDVVITAYQAAVHSKSILANKVRQVVERELRKFERQEQTVERRGALEIAEIKIELAEREYELLRARSTAKKLALMARIAALKQAIDDRLEQINEVKQAKRLAAKIAAAYV